jgi:peptidyl-dipeptidase A
MRDLRSFIDSHVARVQPLSREVNLAYWTATISGRPDDFTRYAALEVELQKIYADREDFARLAHWRESAEPRDPIENRQLDLLHRAYLRNQIDTAKIEAMTHLSSRIVHAFGTYRVRVDGRELSGNDVRAVLKRDPEAGFRKRVWEADKGVGREVRADLLELVRLRNDSARALGFSDFYSMSLELAEQDPGELGALFDRLDDLTRDPFLRVKEEIDAALASRYRIAPSALRPWHYDDPFFQEAPRVFPVDFDRFYRDSDVVSLTSRFFSGIGLDVRNILSRSDLHEKPGKEQHAYCLDIDRLGDIRVLANVQNDENWAGTMLHELGHAVYDRYIDPRLPFLLREHAHVFVTEAVAMLFGRLSKDADWIARMVGIPAPDREAIAQESERTSRLSQIIFARWCQVMTRFERALYADPAQDLNRLWWDLVERYQCVPRPDGRDEPDWAAKIHIVSSPVYYHNYMLGELFASQLDHAVQRAVPATAGGTFSMVGEPAVGEFMRERVFKSGKKYRWDELVRRATGESLGPEHFAAQFVR